LNAVTTTSDLVAVAREVGGDAIAVEAIVHHDTHHHAVEPSRLNGRFRDFLFYASFGFVVTSSVAIAGVLLVFCYLIVPSVAAMLYAESIGRRLAIGWTMGTVVSAIGVYASLLLDLPTGATIVCTFGVALIVMAVLRPVFQRQSVHAMS
jgi:ABC-type Mn2+/Zn2+ transport system permease subunit